MKVLVLGCGPAGLMATHAAAQSGHDVLVYSRKRKSELFGAQYLHKPIDGVTDPARKRTIEYVMQGTASDYRLKVYGPDHRGPVSPDEYAGVHDAWDLRATYGDLWEMYGDYVQDMSVNSEVLHDLIAHLRPDLVLNTIPAKWLCENESHEFKGEMVWAIGDAPERGVFCPITVPKDTVICNGEREPSWYRAANVFGHRTAEWPHYLRPPYGDPAEVVKPLSHDCTCADAYEAPVLGIGRYGMWQKGILSHDAYDMAMLAVNA